MAYSPVDEWGYSLDEDDPSVTGLKGPINPNTTPNAKGNPSGPNAGGGAYAGSGMSSSPKPQGSTATGSGGWASTLSDPSLWSAIIGGASAIANRPKDGKFVQTPLPPEIKQIFDNYMKIWKEQPALRAMAPGIGGMMQAIGTPKFEMTGLVEGHGIPKIGNANNKPYNSTGNQSAFNAGDFFKQFMEYSLGKGNGGGLKLGPNDLSDVRGPAGNPIGGKGRPMSGGKNRDMGEWQAFNFETGGATGYDRANTGMGARDNFGMVKEEWRQTALQNPDFQRAYAHYDKWLTGLPRDEFIKESQRQAQLEARLGKFAEGIIKDPQFYLSLAGGLPGIMAYATNRLGGMALDKAGQYVGNNVEDKRMAQGLQLLIKFAPMIYGAVK